MTGAEVEAALLDDLQRGSADVHELAIAPRLIHIPFSMILAALGRLEDDKKIDLVDPSRSIASGGLICLSGGSK